MTKKSSTIHRLKKHDSDTFKELVALFNKVFENKNKDIPKKSYLKKLLENPDFIVHVAMHNKKVVGGLTAFVLPKYYAKESEILLYDIAITEEFQRKGLGKLLLDSLLEHCKKNKISEVFVAAHKADKNALDFYVSTGGKAEQVVHFNYLVN